MTHPLLPDWARPHYQDGGASPFLFYVVFGSRIDKLALSRGRHRCDAVPQGLDVQLYGPDQLDVTDSFRAGFLWDELQASDPELAALVAAQTSCVVLRGTVNDDQSLNYFRNTIGLLQALMESGGVATYDPQSFKWWSPGSWTTDIFDPGQPLPLRHTAILASEEGNGSHWFHTRGLRKFGRPDLSIHDVSKSHQDAVMDLLNRFIEFQAFGGLIAEHQAVRMASLPPGMLCVHGGDEDDPDFNNTHVEIIWPAGAGQS